MDSDKLTPFRNFIRENLPQWKDLSNSEFEFQSLRGLTNEVFEVKTTKENISPARIIFRKFNEDPHIVNRSLERKLFLELAEKGIGPKCLADSDKYRLEEYIESKTLYGADYNQEKTRRDLARALAKFHKIEVPWIGRKRYLTDDLEDPEFIKPFEDKCNSDVFEEADKEIVKRMKAITGPQEKEFLEELLPKDDFVLSHCDLSNGNQLFRSDLNEVMLIDFEYTGKNFRGFDIGYMYQQSVFGPNPEFPYFKVNLDIFPTDEEFTEFIQYYIAFTDMSPQEDRENGEDLITNKEKLLEYLKEKHNAEELERRVSNLLKETKIGALTCCHYIATWATKMHKTNSNQFGYFEFAKKGFEFYLKFKEEILSTK